MQKPLNVESQNLTCWLPEPEKYTGATTT